MPRMARVVVPGFPHHVTQRGIRKQQTFFCDEDFQLYLSLLNKGVSNVDASILSYCLMPNHVHVIVVPGKKDSLGKLFGWVHGRYAQLINQKKQWFGHLWQARFYSTVMDEAHVLAAMRYVELNPVRAGLCKRPEGWRWSSVHMHLGEAEDRLIDNCVMKKVLPNWSRYVRVRQSEDFNESIRRQTRSGRPMGDDDFIDMVEVVTGRSVRKKPPGPQRSG